MRVLVCGGREFCDWGLLNGVLSNVEDIYGIDLIIQGEAKGADWLAKAWAKWSGIKCVGFPADWKNHKYGAGPIRNQQMLDEGKPDLGVVFPGGSGTADMTARLKKAGVKVIEVD